MPPNRRHKKPTICEICSINESKYACPGPRCLVVYCSVGCYKRHKETCSASTLGRESTAQGASTHTELATATSGEADLASKQERREDEEPSLRDPKPLRPLTSLNWPYIPDESAYPDPLKRDDPKVLQLKDYEAIATSAAIRTTLAAHPQLKTLLRSLDSLRGRERETALQRALGVSDRDLEDYDHDHDLRVGGGGELGDDVRALRELAEGVEGAVRGGRQGALGLDWDG